MTNNKCSPCKNIGNNECSYVETRIKKVFYNEKTGEVLDSNNNFIGIGYYEKGILKIQRTTKKP